MDIERFYREELAYEYAGYELSDRRLVNAVHSFYNHVMENRRLIRQALETLLDYEELLLTIGSSGLKEYQFMRLYYLVDEDVPGVIAATDGIFYDGIHQLLHELEHDKEVAEAFEKETDLMVEKIFFTSLERAYVDDIYAKLRYVDDRMPQVLQNLRREPMENVSKAWDSLFMSFTILYTQALRLDEACEEITGQRCTYFLYDLRKNDKDIEEAHISLVALFNDISMIVHRIADMLASLPQIPKNVEKIAGIDVYIGSHYDPVLLDAVKVWAKTVSVLREHGWEYHRQDISKLHAMVFRDEAVLRVGSAFNHATHIRKVTSGNFKARYYDKDVAVNRLLSEIFKEYVPDVGVTQLEDGLEVTVSSTRGLRKLASLLAFATSLDFIIHDYGYEEAKDKVEKEIKTAVSQLWSF